MIQYTLSFAQYYQHLIKVTLKFKAQPQQKIWLPTWIPGSYLIREFARHVESVKAQQVETGEYIPLHKISKNQWQLHHDQPAEVEVSYQVYAYDLSVRGAYVDDERLYVNPAAVCMGVAGQEEDAIELHLQVPEPLQCLQLATSLKVVQAGSTAYQLVAASYHALIDQPFELARQTCATFKAGGIEHRIAISGRHQANLTRLATDLEKICAAQIELFGDAPFDHYLFMVMATANSYGGLEHHNCTSLISPRDDLPKTSESARPSTSYQRFLGLCSHEYFHAWLVKFIRPHNYVRPNLHQEDYTTLLWVFEGITSYYDDLMLYRSGVIDQQAYLDLLKEQVSRYLGNPGRHIQSIAESSFDAWIKYYRPDENSNNAGTSYYNKGALVALCLDLSLRQQGSSLDALMQALYARAKQGQQVHEETLPLLCQQLTGQSFMEFFKRYTEGTEELPLAQLLADAGIKLQQEDKLWPLGLKVQETPQGLLVQQVLRDSAAACAGLSAQDTIVALNDLKATNALLVQLGGQAEIILEQQRQIQASQQQGSPEQDHIQKDKSPEDSQQQSKAAPSDPSIAESDIYCYAFRRDELKTMTIEARAFKTTTASLTVEDQQRLGQWLG